ncbi:MAG: hypothetical protein ACLQVN_13405 [Bryobacteraceae bacterium]
MRPVHIVILVLAGALGGAAVMRVAELRRESASSPVRANPGAPAAVAAAEPAPAAIPAPEPAPAPPVEPAPPARRAARPAPVAAPARRATRPSPFHPRMLAAAEPPAQAVPQARPNEPAAAATSPPAPMAGPEPIAPAPEPARQTSPAPPPASPETESATPAPAERIPNTVTLNAGLLIPVRLLDSLSSDRNAAGDGFTATLDHELVVDGFVIAERGARVEGRVVASNPGKLGNAAAIAVELTRLNTSDGQQVAIRTDSFEKHAEPNRGADVETVAGGAVLGAVIGGIVGGGKGAAIGAGAGAGAGGVALAHTRPAALPSETRITFRLRTPITLTERLGG